MIQHLRELFAQERRNDGWRRFVGSQAMGVGGTHDRGFQQTVVVVYRHQGVDNEGDEAQIIFGGLARSHQQDAGVCTQ